MNRMYSDFKWNRVLWKDRKLATYGPKDPKRWEKRRGKKMKESFRCCCDPAAEYFNVCATREGQAPFGHPLVLWWGLSVCEANRNCTSSTANTPSDRTRGCHRGKEQQDLTDKVIFPSPIPSLLSPRDVLMHCIHHVWYNIPWQISQKPWSPWILVPGSYPRAQLCSARGRTWT